MAEHCDLRPRKFTRNPDKNAISKIKFQIYVDQQIAFQIYAFFFRNGLVVSITELVYSKSLKLCLLLFYTLSNIKSNT